MMKSLIDRTITIPIFRALFSTVLTMLVSSLFFISILSHAQNIQMHENLIFEVEDLRSDQHSGLLFDSVHFFLHDGTFDLFDFGKPASEGLRWFANHGLIDELKEEMNATGFEFVRHWEVRLNFPAYDGASPRVRPEWFHPPPPDPVDRSARYLSFIARVHPGDDAFIGNEDPQRYEVFDENGQFQGPIVIDIYGTDILDAGTKENLEQNLIGLDRHLFDERGDPLDEPFTTDPVMPHRGFNGSYRNPDGEPVRLMLGGEAYCHESSSGDEFCHDYDPSNIDFSRPGQPLMRLRASAVEQTFHGGWSGSYFDRERSGEGFNFEFFDDDPPRALLYWYTYQHDGSGAPMWLIGDGALNEENKMVFEIYETIGGQMAAPSNPETVTSTPWGHAVVLPQATNIPACRGLWLLVTPNDHSLELDLPLYSEPATYLYSVEALTTDLTGLDHYCGNRNPFAVY